jgi:uncharacterized membrane protein YhaH (DUF805 family)
MDNKWFLFGFEGRINRAKYWLATLIILASMILSLLLLTVICLSHGIATGPLSVNLVGISASIQLTDDDAPAALFPRLAALAMTLAFGWCYAVASIKRLHDRNKSGWWIVPYLVGARSLRSIRRLAWRFVAGRVHRLCHVHCPRLGRGRDVLPARDARAEPVRGRSAGSC